MIRRDWGPGCSTQVGFVIVAVAHGRESVAPEVSILISRVEELRESMFCHADRRILLIGEPFVDGTGTPLTRRFHPARPRGHGGVN